MLRMYFMLCVSPSISYIIFTTVSEQTWRFSVVLERLESQLIATGKQQKTIEKSQLSTGTVPRSIFVCIWRSL
jgi:hypothetical protein